MNNFTLIEDGEEKGDPKDVPLFSPLSQDTKSFVPFVSGKTSDKIQGFFQKDKFATTLKNLDDLQTIWKLLLVDAIYFLKINDKREREYFEKSTIKTTMDTENAAKTAIDSVYGVEDLYKYFRRFAEFESTLYGSDKYYRDHVVHPLKVWLIGQHILKTFGDTFYSSIGGQHVPVHLADHADPNPDPPQDRYVDSLYISTAELSAMWAIVALTHDLGYPLEKVEKINDRLESMLSEFGNIGFSRSSFSFQTQHDHLVRVMLNLISSVVCEKPGSSPQADAKGNVIKEWATRIRTKFHTKFSKSWEMFDHGIVSSLLLLKSLTFFIESDLVSDNLSKLSGEDARQFTIRSEILHAIASHTTPKIYHLSANTLSFLLVLCDELQEWGRPRMTELRSGRLKSGADEVVIDACSISSDDSTISCSIHYTEEISASEQIEHARRSFKAWHERLRPAVDDTKRKMHFTWKLHFPNNVVPWVFDLDTHRDVFKQLDCHGPLDGKSDDQILQLYT